MTTDQKQPLAISYLACGQYKEKQVILMVYGHEWMAVCAQTGQILVIPQGPSSQAIQIEESLLPKDKIRSVAIHPESGVFATIADDKTLSCWSLESFERVSHIELLKRANGVCFSKDGSKVLVGDKFGDVYTCSTVEPKGLKLLLGHVSMILDIIISPDGQFVLTADRDEKIRTSHYPNAFDIESFCLGHQEFISCIHIPQCAQNLLISGGGDAMVGVWDYKQGKLLSSFDLSDYKLSIQDQPYSHVVKCICSFHDTICVVLEGAPFILLLQLSDAKLTLKQKVDLDRDVLSACFDGQGQLWISFGTMQGQSPLQDTLVSVLSLDAESNLYMTGKQELTSQIHAAVSEIPDYYEVSKLGKEVIIQKFHKRDENKKFQPKNKNKKESESKRGAASEIEDETTKKMKTTA